MPCCVMLPGMLHGEARQPRATACSPEHARQVSVSGRDGRHEIVEVEAVALKDVLRRERREHDMAGLHVSLRDAQRQTRHTRAATDAAP